MCCKVNKAKKSVCWSGTGEQVVTSSRSSLLSFPYIFTLILGFFALTLSGVRCSLLPPVFLVTPFLLSLHCLFFSIHFLLPHIPSFIPSHSLFFLLLFLFPAHLSTFALAQGRNQHASPPFLTSPPPSLPSLSLTLFLDTSTLSRVKHRPPLVPYIPFFLPPFHL